MLNRATMANKARLGPNAIYYTGLYSPNARQAGTGLPMRSRYNFLHDCYNQTIDNASGSGIMMVAVRINPPSGGANEEVRERHGRQDRTDWVLQ